jgi:aryl-alcohol dehydrogenase-like predicted oxidoreductase
MTNEFSRRSLLLSGGAAVLGCIGLGGLTLASERIRLRKRNSPAGAAGTFWIGGDFEVNRIGLGTARLGGKQGWGDPGGAREARAVLRRAIELGVNFLDTADIYGPEFSEQLIREALHPYPSDLLIATKGGQIRTSSDKFLELDGRPEHLRAACEASLRRLKLEQIPLYHMHWPDRNVPYEDSIGELARLQAEGKIRHIGVCNVDMALLAKARSVARIVSVQNRYNVAFRESENILALCEREKMAFLPYQPLAQREQAKAETNDVRVAGLQGLAEKRHLEMPAATIGWLLTRSPVIIPIPGTSQVEHLEENVAAARIRFTREEMAQIG